MIKKFFCWIGLHSLLVGLDDKHYHTSDPLNWDLRYARCRWCGKELYL